MSSSSAVPPNHPKHSPAQAIHLVLRYFWEYIATTHLEAHYRTPKASIPITHWTSPVKSQNVWQTSANKFNKMSDILQMSGESKNVLHILATDSATQLP